MKKKIVSISLIVTALLLAVTGITLAYFTDNEESVNTFTMGNVDIELSETEWVAPANAVPAVAYEKNPTVTNVGANPAWIKVDVTVSDAKAFTAAASKHGITDLASVFTVSEDFDDKWVLAGITEPTDESDTLTYSYYYRNLLETGASTGALFTAVTIPKQFNNADMASIGEDFTVTVTAHAMQDAGFANVQAAYAEYIFEAK